MDEIQKMELLYGRAKVGARSAIRKAVKLFQLEIIDEETGEYNSQTDLELLFDKIEKRKTMSIKNKKEVAETSQARKEITLEQIPFFLFETEGETFKGKLLHKHSITFNGQSVNTYVCEDDLGTQVIMPTNVQLQLLLNTLANTNDLPCGVEIVFEGTKQTPKGRAKQFRVYSI